MHIGLFDFISIAFFLILTSLFYKKGWFYSSYTFAKFLVVSLTSLVLGLIAATANPYSFIITKLQFALFIMALTFIMLWMVVSFEKYFFPISRSLNISRLFFITRIDKVLSFLSSSIVSFFICFIIFTFLISLSTRILVLQKSIEGSKITAPIAYKVYFQELPFKSFGLFDGVAYQIFPESDHPQSHPTPVPQNIVPTQINNRTNRTFYPPTQAHIQPTNTLIPTPIQSGPTRAVFPTNKALPNQPNPTSTPIPTLVPTNTPTPTREPINLPTATLVPTIFVPTPTITIVQPVFQPPPINTAQAEQDVFRLTNQERVKAGLPQFTWNEQVAAIARRHSQDMADRNFFSHVSPDGGDITSRFRYGGVSFLTAGENIARGATAQILVHMWMNSEPHKRSILSPEFGQIGVGIAQDPRFGLSATQNFKD